MAMIDKLSGIPGTPKISGRIPGPGPTPPLIIAICGDTASGKSSIVAALKERGFTEIVLHTSREIRADEVAGRDYNYLAPDEFLERVRTDSFMGVDRVGNALYGVIPVTIDVN